MPLFKCGLTTPSVKFILLFSKRFCCFSLLLLVSIIGVSNPHAQIAPIPASGSYQIEADLGRIHFYLITVDVGDQVWDNFGHTALRVVDEANNSDTVFNWGLFDASGGVVNFSYNFFKGVMNYRLGTTSPAREFAQYAGQERTVWQDKLNLTNQQKEILYRRLLWNIEPRNVEYPYNYFFDNCTTRIRDYLNEALFGKIANSNTGVTGYSFRDQVQSHYKSVGLVSISLDILMNSNIDREVSEWEEMFLPLSLRTRLLGLSSDVAINGQRQNLLTETEVVRAFPTPSAQTDPYRLAAMILLGPTLLLYLLLKKNSRPFFATQFKIGFKIPGISFRLLGALGLLTGLFSGIYGLLMLGSWFVSDHLDLHHNVNLLLFWPTDLFVIIVSLRWLFICKPWPMTINHKPFIDYYLLAHVVGMVIYSLVWLLGYSAQLIDSIYYYVVPGFFLFTVLVWLVGFKAARPKGVLY
jgi:hypothetical protein